MKIQTHSKNMIFMKHFVCKCLNPFKFLLWWMTIDYSWNKNDRTHAHADACSKVSVKQIGFNVKQRCGTMWFWFSFSFKSIYNESCTISLYRCQRIVMTLEMANGQNFIFSNLELRIVFNAFQIHLQNILTTLEFG